MTTKTKEELKDLGIKAFQMFVVFTIVMLAIFSIPTCDAQETKKQSDWTEIKSVEIPFGEPIFEGITRNGNPKYWFDFNGIKVNVSPSNAEKYKNNSVTLMLVEWYNKTTGRYKYSVRQKKGSTKAVKLDIDTLF